MSLSLLSVAATPTSVRKNAGTCIFLAANTLDTLGAITLLVVGILGMRGTLLSAPTTGALFVGIGATNLTFLALGLCTLARIQHAQRQQESA